ncbi:MAG: hypothetical protein ABIQ39_15650 [Ilumatobacteraceae bacterium]
MTQTQRGDSWFQSLDPAAQKFVIILAIIIALVCISKAVSPNSYKLHSTQHDQCEQANTENGTSYACPD